jgi:hypothetical protein
MADPNIGIQSFLPWVRQGLSALPADTLGAGLAASVSTPVEVRTLGFSPIVQRVKLNGPGDVTALDPRNIIRTEPAAFSRNFEPNLLAAVEFDRPDFPWLFTPASPNAQNRLRPWLCLVVVRQQEGVNILGGADRPLPVLEIKPPASVAAELPNLAESWAWAHGQVTGSLAQAPISQVDARSPERTLSRLLCPRRLTASTSYHACLVPAFLAGVRTGLGFTTEETPDLRPAWEPNAASVLLPIYFRWEFSTGPDGDFASLVKLITLYQFPPGTGVRDLAIGRAGQRLPASTTEVAGLESALVTPGTIPRPFSNPFAGQFKTALRTLLEPAADAEADPLVTLPLYAGRHVGQLRPPADNAVPHWLRELNLHPGYRAIAGWGTRVVQDQQEALMASAWEQVGEVEQANHLLRNAQLMRAAAAGLYQRSFSRLASGSLLEVSRPVHSRIAVGVQTTMQKVLTSARMPTAVLAPEFRKVARPRGPLLRSVLPVAQRKTRAITAKVAGNTVKVYSPPPVGTPVTPERVETMFRQGGGTRPANAAVVAFLRMQSLPVATIPPKPGFTITAPEFTVIPPVRPPVRPPVLPPVILRAAGVDSVQAGRYRTAITAHQALLGPSFMVFIAPVTTLKMETVSPMVLGQLHPDVAVSGWARSLATVAGEPAAGNDLEPVAAAPEFPQPMYAALRELAPDLIAPGLDAVPDNKVALLETNPRFVESFMAGLNHEMARELLWRGYPTDQRGTYFRTFWDSRGRPSSVVATTAGDIPRLHTWPAAKHLGEIAAGSANSLVLLIKAELLRRYPNAVIYAVAATLAPGQTKPKLGTVETHPVFRGSLDPDVSFFGFPFTKAQAIANPGFFFVIQEHPTEPSFGLPANAPPSTVPRPAADAAATARSLLQRPVRLAIHARDLLKS